MLIKTNANASPTINMLGFHLLIVSSYFNIFGEFLHLFVNSSKFTRSAECSKIDEHPADDPFRVNIKVFANENGLVKRQKPLRCNGFQTNCGGEGGILTLARF